MSLSLLLYDYPEQDCNGGGKRIRSCYLKEQRFSGRKGKKKARGVKKSGREREVEMLCVHVCVLTLSYPIS